MGFKAPFNEPQHFNGNGELIKGKNPFNPAVSVAPEGERDYKEKA
jgi:hypothetical protein